MTNRSLPKLLLLLLLLPDLASAAGPIQRLQQLVDYVGVDYPGAVSAGKIEDQTEFVEMTDFTNTMAELATRLPPSPQKMEIRQGIERLARLVEAKADASRVADQSSRLRHRLISAYGIQVTPRKTPDPHRAEVLYAQACAGCHGASGHGDGPLAATLDQKPTDFTDVSRYRARTLHGLYATITEGVAGTAMPSHTDMSEQDRWSLAFHVGRLALAETPISATLPADIRQRVSLEDMTTQTPAELAAHLGAEGQQWVDLLRMHPGALFASNGASLELARRQLAQALSAYRAGKIDQTHELAVSAYLEGFEPVEGNLDAVDATLRHEIEGRMTMLRGQIRNGAKASTIAGSIGAIDELLQTAADRLDNTRLLASTAFTSALLILLREGLEAILVVAALAAFLIKTRRSDGLRYLYAGVGAALALGGLTWYLSTYVVAIGGAGRELTEGVAALFAAAMLFYVGFWLHGKSGAAQWKGFIQDSVRKALGKGTLWGLAGLAFIAVYREILETMLFYQALWMQTSEDGRGMLLTGLSTAIVLLVILAWLVLRYSTRLPLRQFFSVTGLFMFVLAVVFAGKGIAALQEAGKLPANLVDLPSIELFGIYPNLQGLAVQLALILLAAALLLRSRRHPS